MGRKLFVGNLSFNTEESRLQELFEAIQVVFHDREGFLHGLRRRKVYAGALEHLHRVSR